MVMIYWTGSTEANFQQQITKITNEAWYLPTVSMGTYIIIDVRLLKLSDTMVHWL